MENREIREEFYIEEKATAQNGKLYKTFIDRLRIRLAGTRKVHNRAVLPSLAEIPANHPRFQIVLRTKSNRVTFLYRRRDLYLEAYRSEHLNTWFELQDSEDQTSHVVPGSTFLGFFGTYDSLQHAGRKKDAKGKFIEGSGERSSLPLGHHALGDAVDNLATTTAYDERARSLTMIIQMTSETLRYEQIQSFLAEKWSGKDAKPTGEILRLENGWKKFSQALLQYNAHPSPDDPQKKVFPCLVDNIPYTFEQVITAIALILYVDVRGIPNQLHYTRSADHGRALLEVFEVIINNIDGETQQGDLYGTIIVTDGLLYQDIYNRERSIPESVNLNEKVTLTGPTQACVSAMNEYLIDVALMAKKDADLSNSPDDDKVVGKGKIFSSVYDTNVYDKPLSHKIDGTFGSITSVYGVLSNAVQAYVEVILINANDKDTAVVYGNISAVNTNPEFEKHESVLFNRDSGDIIQVGKGGVIPLSRSIVAVPLNSQLTIRADLLGRDTTESNPGDEIAKGTSNFPAKLDGEVHGFIDGQCGQIKVKVTWIP